MTRVQLLWLAKRIENRLRFGRTVEERRLDHFRRVVFFAPGCIFGFVCWASNDFGTVPSRIDILRAVGAREPCSTVPYVGPGAGILLHISGWLKVERVLQQIDAIEALSIDRADVAQEHWRHVQSRLTANELPRSYTRLRHQAWLRRRGVMP